MASAETTSGPVQDQSPPAPTQNGSIEADRPTDEEILRYERAIKQSETSKPLVSEKINFDELWAEYAGGDPVYLQKIQNLRNECTSLRTIRKDGNCFYRAVAFRFAELVRQYRPSAWSDFAAHRAAEHTKDLQTATGYEVSVLEDFLEPFANILKPIVEVRLEDGFEQEQAIKRNVVSEQTLNSAEQEILKAFQLEYMSDTIVCYLRLVTAAELKKNRDMYEAFLDGLTMEQFISSQVEPMNVEADHLQLVAVSNALAINIRVGNLDPTKTESGAVNYHEFTPFMMDPSDIPATNGNSLGLPSSPEVVLLYRPGHYDVLYPSY